MIYIEEESRLEQLGFVDLQEALKKEEAISFINLCVNTKTITLIGGQSMVGKTVICLHIANRCVSQRIKVAYFDTDKRPITNRPEPNLLKYFQTNNPQGYKDYFMYSNNFYEKNILEVIATCKPKVVIIDSIYSPYVEKYPKSPRQRAKAIRMFLMRLRDLMFEHNVAVILTTQVGKELNSSMDGHEMISYILGGEGLKHLSDCKWILDFKSANKGDVPSDRKYGEESRYLFIDRQEIIALTIGYGGFIRKMERTERVIGE